MSIMKIGEKGLAEVNLIIPQKCSFAFTIEHKNSNGNPISHVNSTIHMVLMSKYNAASFDFSNRCTGTATGISVELSPEDTADLPLGYMAWDLIAEMQVGQTVRLAYGNVNVVDTYALDGDE